MDKDETPVEMLIEDSGKCPPYVWHAFEFHEAFSAGSPMLSPVQLCNRGVARPSSNGDIDFRIKRERSICYVSDGWYKPLSFRCRRSIGKLHKRQGSGWVVCVLSLKPHGTCWSTLQWGP